MPDALDAAAADLKAKYEAWKLISGRVLPSDALILAAGRNSDWTGYFFPAFRGLHLAGFYCARRGRPI